MKNKQPGLSLIIFVFAVSTSLFILSGQFINYYRFKITGALFELLHLPSLMLMVFILVYSFVRILKEKLTFRSMHVYSFLVIILTLGYLMLFIQ